MFGDALGTQLFLIAASIAGMAVALLRQRFSPLSKVMLAVTGMIVCAALGGALSGYSRVHQRIESDTALDAEIPARLVRSPDESASSYVSSDRCQACHPGNYASWHDSYHRTMTQKASPEAILGRFEGQALEARGRRYRLERRGEEFWVEMADPDWERDQLDAGRRPERVPDPPRRWKRVVMTTGSHHMQTYWVASDRDGRLFNFPWLWLVEDQRWIPREEGFIRPPDGPRTFDVWHGACIECHSVAGEKTRDPQGEWAPEAAELGIACEACHGPADEHVRRNRSPIRRYLTRLGGKPDPAIVNPAKLDARAASQVCGQCHGINLFKGYVRQTGARYQPGDELTDTRIIMRATSKATRDAAAAVYAAERGSPLPALARDHRDMQKIFKRELARDESFLRDRFWPDGMVRVSGREHNSLIESACFEGGELSCLTCHSMHEGDPDDQLAENASGRGDEACLECHSTFRDDIPAHTHHAAASSGSQCTNCHMPHTVYGLLKSIRSHWIDSPSTATTLATGRPNACELCHLDRPLGWTADRLAQWYGQPRPALSPDEEKIASGVRWLLVGNAQQRAIAAWHLGWPGAQAALEAGREDADRWQAFFLGHLLDDPYPAVRYIAERSLRTTSAADRLDYDFLAAAPERSAARERMLSDWTPSDFDWPTFERLARLRDDQKMDLRE